MLFTSILPYQLPQYMANKTVCWQKASCFFISAPFLLFYSGILKVAHRRKDKLSNPEPWLLTPFPLPYCPRPDTKSSVSFNFPENPCFQESKLVIRLDSWVAVLRVVLQIDSYPSALWMVLVHNKSVFDLKSGFTHLPWVNYQGSVNSDSAEHSPTSSHLKKHRHEKVVGELSQKPRRAVISREFQSE